jgi:hypothetical protein
VSFVNKAPGTFSSWSVLVDYSNSNSQVKYLAGPTLFLLITQLDGSFKCVFGMSFDAYSRKIFIKGEEDVLHALVNQL